MDSKLDSLLISYPESSHSMLKLYLSNAKSQRHRKRVEFCMEDEGIGKHPPALPFLGSLLLFNSDVNPYASYTNHDNLVDTGR